MAAPSQCQGQWLGPSGLGLGLLKSNPPSPIPRILRLPHSPKDSAIVHNLGLLVVKSHTELPTESHVLLS